jgi:hypothetical protein
MKTQHENDTKQVQDLHEELERIARLLLEESSHAPAPAVQAA